MWTGSLHHLKLFCFVWFEYFFSPFFNSHTFFHLITSWISSLRLSRRWVFSSKPFIISLWSCSTFFWDAYKIFLVWVTRHWGMLMLLQVTVCLSILICEIIPILASYCAVLCLVVQSCPTLHDQTVACQASQSMGILQARTLEWVAMLSSRGSSRPRDQTQVSRIASGYFFLLSEP